MKNKKAQLGFSLIDIYSYILFAFIIIVFFVVFNMAKPKPDTISLTGEKTALLDASANLKSFLKLPVSINDPATPEIGIISMEMAELLSLYYMQQSNTKEEKDIKEAYSKIIEGLADDYLTKLEYFYPNPKNPKVCFIRGFMVFLTADASKNLEGTGISNKKFRSEHAISDNIGVVITSRLFLPDNSILYVKWAEMSYMSKGVAC